MSVVQIGSKDAVRLLQTSQFSAASFLSDYHFVDRVFTFPNCSVDEVQLSVSFYVRYNMRILRKCLPAEWDEFEVEEE